MSAPNAIVSLNEEPYALDNSDAVSVTCFLILPKSLADVAAKPP